MKIIATAAVLTMLSVPAWADEAEKQSNKPANSKKPIVLSEAEMDDVTAGTDSYGRVKVEFLWDREGSSTSQQTDYSWTAQILPHIEQN